MLHLFFLWKIHGHPALTNIGRHNTEFLKTQWTPELLGLRLPELGILWIADWNQLVELPSWGRKLPISHFPIPDLSVLLPQPALGFLFNNTVKTLLITKQHCHLPNTLLMSPAFYFWPAVCECSCDEQLTINTAIISNHDENVGLAKGDRALASCWQHSLLLKF